MKKIKYIFSLVTFLIILSLPLGFYLYKKKYIIEEEKMGSILAYMNCLNQNNNNFSKSSSLILKVYDVTPIQFEKSIKYYSKNLNKLRLVYKSALDEILLQKAITKGEE